MGQFVKHCKRSWERRKAKLRDCHRRTGYKNLQDWWNDIEFNDLLPKGISNTQRRKFILLNTLTIAEVWETGFKKLPNDKQVAVEQVFERDEKRRKTWPRTLAGCHSHRTSGICVARSTCQII